MIRAITVTALVALLILVLYLPSAYPPQRFLSQLQTDHATTARFWGKTEALQLLDATLSRQRDVRDVAPLPDAYDAPSTQRLDGAVAQEMSSVNNRLFNSPYFRSLDAMLVLPIWGAVGMVIYFGYSRSRSHLGRGLVEVHEGEISDIEPPLPGSQ